MLPALDKNRAMIAELNLRALEHVSRFLYSDSRAITEEDIRQLTDEFHIDEHEAVVLLFCAFCGLDQENNQTDRILERYYFHPTLKRLDVAHYSENPYYQRIKLPETSIGNWQFTTKTYQPYEIFVCDDLSITDDGMEIPQLGYFTETFAYPAVLENGREWMTITPNEIATMAEPLRHMRGKIAVLGLGLGYFAYMASEQPAVSSIVIVERENSVIELFRQHILPQFPHKEKISIVQTDAFDYIGSNPDVDSVFVDLWHDVYDGIGLYLRMKRLEQRMPAAHFEYWIERSLLAWLRGMAIEEWASGEADILLPVLTRYPVWRSLSDEFLRSIAHEIPLEIAPE